MAHFTRGHILEIVCVSYRGPPLICQQYQLLCNPPHPTCLFLPPAQVTTIVGKDPQGLQVCLGIREAKLFTRNCNLAELTSVCTERVSIVSVTARLGPTAQVKFTGMWR